MAKALKDSLKEIQILLGKPHKKIAGTLKYYLNFLNIQDDSEKSSATKKNGLLTIKHKAITWVDISSPNRRVISQLAQEYPFHPLHLEDAISKGQFPKIEQSTEDDYLFILLRMPRYKLDEGKIVINQICFFLGKEYLVTVHEDSTDSISKIFNDCLENAHEREAYIDSSSPHLLYTIIDQLSKDLAVPLQAVQKEVDEAEDIVFDDKLSGVFKIGQLRQRIIGLRRVIGPLRTLLADMAVRINNFSKTNLTVYFENIIHRVEKAWENLEEARETVEVYKDADFTYSTEKTNKILAALTIIFTLTIPATVIGTLYGMNIILPGGIESGNWMFFGKYTTFVIILLVITLPTILMQLYFKKRGWF